MAQYKVPQNVEAEDKLLGPFSFRQFVYLLIAGGLIALAVGLWNIFKPLVIIPVPFVLFFGALALPLRKDQPMETYLAAMVSYYLKPRNRFWIPGQRESTIEITAPKIVEESRTRDITGEEATHRLSFLADIVDTEGYAVKGASTNLMRDDLVAEADAMVDMFEGNHFENLNDVIQKDEMERHEEVVKGMQDVISNTAEISTTELDEKPEETIATNVFMEEPKLSPVVILPDTSVANKPVEKSNQSTENVTKKISNSEAKSSIIELANNDAFSVATIAEQAKRINRKDEGEVFISLH